MPTEILKVLVGSQAHGTATESSDFDYRGVFAHPTENLLMIRSGKSPKSTNWQEGKVDDTSWEVAHFLHLATKSNPTIMEVFGAPVENAHPVYGERLRGLLPHVWSTRAVWNAFRGYARNKWRKVESDLYEPNVSNGMDKNVLATCRVLRQGAHLMRTGEMVVADAPWVKEQLELREAIEDGYMTVGQILDFKAELERQLWVACEERGWEKATDLEPVNEYLLDLRRYMWEMD